MSSIDAVDFGMDAETEAAAAPLFQKFGLAVAWGQTLELLLAQHIVLLRWSRRNPRRPYDGDRVLFQKLSQAVGPLLEELIALLDDDFPLADDLRSARDLRNHLAHSFWRTRLFLVGTEAGRTQIEGDLDAANVFMLDVITRLLEHGAELRMSVGITPEVEALAEEFGRSLYDGAEFDLSWLDPRGVDPHSLGSGTDDEAEPAENPAG